MKPLNLKEFAEQMLLSDDREFAIEILENLDFVETANYDELCKEITYHSEEEFKKHDPCKQIERMGDRLNVLDIIQDILNEHKLDGDPEDEVRDLATTHRTIEGSLRDKGLLAPDGDILESVLQLLERVPQYDL
jgi:hypothetical protein